MVSVLVGVVAAASVHLFWLPPSNDDTTLARSEEPDPELEHGARPGGGETRTAPPSTSGGKTVSTTSTPSPTTPEPEPEASAEPIPSGVASSNPDESSVEGSATENTGSTESSEPPASNAGDHAEQVVALVNDARAEAGCAPVRVDHRLTESAQAHSDDMAEHNYLSHTSLDGTTFDERISEAGYPHPAAENIAMGMASAEAVMDAWMDSEGHRRNIVNCKITAIGVGVNPDGWYWTQNFGY
ncbi:CAP domain-containing protein [Saccharomonospora viridis]|nr:CAP domain-containing protein [Saccharomonospora viridis]